jgi:hypothetical protein
MAASFVVPGPEDRTVIIGQSGSGKTVLGAFLLSLQNFEKRPWVALDFKDETLWDQVGEPPMRELRLGQMPGKRGLYRLHVDPWDEEDLEAWLKEVWRRGNIGLFADEAALLPQKGAVRAILRQGRSKRIPFIGCTQRPVGCDREIFSEANYRACFGVEDHRDYQVIRGLFGNTDIRDECERLHRHWSVWWDVNRKNLVTLQPSPPPAKVAEDLRARVPYSFFLGA